MFFLHKKGNKADPNNYRSINVQNPFLKCFSAILAKRLAAYSEERGLLNDFQFGFRARRSTFAAATLLNEIVNSRLKKGQKTFACFVDFKKAFDSVDRTLLFEKLQKLSIPYQFCKTLFNIFNNTRIHIKAGDLLSSPFLSNIGTPQGDSIAALLFTLFLSDIERKLPSLGPMLNGVRITAIMYADDICLLTESYEDMQNLLIALKSYCDDNKLIVNVEKTKVMIFHRGSCKPFTFTYVWRSRIRSRKILHLSRL